MNAQIIGMNIDESYDPPVVDVTFTYPVGKTASGVIAGERMDHAQFVITLPQKEASGFKIGQVANIEITA